MVAVEVMKGVKDTPFCGVEPSRQRCRGLRAEEGEIESPRGDYHSKWIGRGYWAHPPRRSLSSFFYNDRRTRLLS